MGEHQQRPVDEGESHPSMDRRGEEVSQQEHEAGRRDTGDQGASQRPTGTSSAGDYAGVDPQEPRDGGSPAG